jgi:hypothetical protein
MPMSAAAAMEAIIRYDMRVAFLGYFKINQILPV